MRPDGKKTWDDLLVSDANLADTPAKKKLRAWLWTIAKYKHKRMPMRILRALERVKSKVHFVWGLPDPVTAYSIELQKEFKKELPEGDRLIPFVESTIKRLGETAESRAAALKARGWDLRPCLVNYESLGEFDTYLWRLIPKLMDPDWVAALRICPGPKCKKLIMSSAKWERKFCSEACKNRYWGRKNRERDKNDPSEEMFECPGNFEHVTIRRGECLNGNGMNIRGKFREECPRCPHNKKGGRQNGAAN